MMARVLIQEVHPDKGYPYLALGGFDMLNPLGCAVNSKGLYIGTLGNVASSKITMAAYGGKNAGLSDCQVTNLVMSTCSDLPEAQKILESNSIYFPILDMHFIVADTSGNSFVWDRDAHGGQGHFTYNNGGSQVITNHPLYTDFPTSALKPDPDYPQYFSLDRYNILAKAIADHASKFSPEDIKRTLSLVDARGFSYGTHGYRAPKPVPFRTSWAVLWDLNEKSMQVKFYLRDKEGKPEADGLPGIVYSDLYSFKLGGR